MVYYFTSNTVTPSAFIYVGKDKVENEELIAYGVVEDVWVRIERPDHLERFAHVYLRMNEGETWDKIPAGLLLDCAQLTKANSIEGNKKDNVTIIYTPWSNLKKNGTMAVGQVGFQDPRMVRKILVQKRENAIINRLTKTRVERFPDLYMEREERLKAQNKKTQAAVIARKKEEAKIAKERQELKHLKDHAYDHLFTEENLAQSSNQDREEDFLDDFM